MDHLESDLPLGESDSAAKGILIVRVDALRNFTGLVTGLGGDALSLLRKARIAPAILDNRNAVIAYRAMVQLLERAVELEPEDPTINGHLGDAYSAAGRMLEAQYQWRRALTLNPEPEELPRLQAKLHDAEQALGTATTAAKAQPAAAAQP